jgi:hypothetical protein
VLAVGLSVTLLGQRPIASDGSQNYAIAVEVLKNQYKGPTKFFVSGLRDKETKLEPISNGYIVHGLLYSDSPDVIRVSADCKVRFHVTVMGPKKEYWVFGGTTYSTKSSDVHIEKSN